MTGTINKFEHNKPQKQPAFGTRISRVSNTARSILQANYKEMGDDYKLSHYAITNNTIKDFLQIGHDGDYITAEYKPYRNARSAHSTFKDTKGLTLESIYQAMANLARENNIRRKY